MSKNAKKAPAENVKPELRSGLFAEICRLKGPRKQLYALLYLLPSLIIFAVFMVYPVLYNLYLSFFKWNMVTPTKQFVGLQNYATVLHSSEFWQAILNTLGYVGILLATCFVLPYFVSFILGHVIRRGSKFYRATLFFPSLLSLAVASTVFVWIFNAINGPVAIITKQLGLPSVNWFNTPKYVIVALAIVTAWRTFGYNMIVFLAAVIEVPTELIEAARLEKASNWTIFWKIVFPLTSPTALYVFVITFVFGLQYVFTPINMITQGGPSQHSTNLVYIIYQYAFNFFKSGEAATFAILTFVLFMVVVLLQKWLEKKVYYEI